MSTRTFFKNKKNGQIHNVYNLIAISFRLVCMYVGETLQPYLFKKIICT